MSAYLNWTGQYEHVRADSIDYSVMEKSSHVSVLPVDFSWCDVGNVEVFLSLKERHADLDANVIAVNSHNNLIDVPNKLIALVGVDNLCVVDTDDALLIVRRDQSEKVKAVVNRLKIQASYL